MRKLLSVTLITLIFGVWGAEHPAQAASYAGAASTRCCPVTQECSGHVDYQLQRQTCLQNGSARDGLRDPAGHHPARRRGNGHAAEDDHDDPIGARAVCPGCSLHDSAAVLSDGDAPLRLHRSAAGDPDNLEAVHLHGESTGPGDPFRDAYVQRLPAGPRDRASRRACTHNVPARPVREVSYKECYYSVCRPVQETIRQERSPTTVCRPVSQTCYKTCSYTVLNRPGAEGLLPDGPVHGSGAGPRDRHAVPAVHRRGAGQAVRVQAGGVHRLPAGPRDGDAGAAVHGHDARSKDACMIGPAPAPPSAARCARDCDARECRYTVCVPHPGRPATMRTVTETCYKQVVETACREVCETVCVPRQVTQQVTRQMRQEWVTLLCCSCRASAVCVDYGCLGAVPGDVVLPSRSWCPRTVVEDVCCTVYEPQEDSASRSRTPSADRSPTASDQAGARHRLHDGAAGVRQDGARDHLPDGPGGLHQAGPRDDLRDGPDRVRPLRAGHDVPDGSGNLLQDRTLHLLHAGGPHLHAARAGLRHAHVLQDHVPPGGVQRHLHGAARPATKTVHVHGHPDGQGEPATSRCRCTTCPDGPRKPACERVPVTTCRMVTTQCVKRGAGDRTCRTVVRRPKTYRRSSGDHLAGWLQETCVEAGAADDLRDGLRDAVREVRAASTVCEMQTINCVRKECYTVCRQVPETTVVHCPVTVTKQVPVTRTVCVPRQVCRQVPVEVCVRVPVVVHCPEPVLPSAQSVLATEQSVSPLTTLPACSTCEKATS